MNPSMGVHELCSLELNISVGTLIDSFKATYFYKSFEECQVAIVILEKRFGVEVGHLKHSHMCAGDDIRWDSMVVGMRDRRKGPQRLLLDGMEL